MIDGMMQAAGNYGDLVRACVQARERASEAAQPRVLRKGIPAYAVLWLVYSNSYLYLSVSRGLLLVLLLLLLLCG